LGSAASAGLAPREVAFELLRTVAERAAYANLALPGLLEARQLAPRDAALATELGYGTLRATGTLDEIIASCSNRPLVELDPPVLDLLRLGAYQLLRTRIPSHAAVATTVELAARTGNARSRGFVNAVLRRVSQADWDAWTDQLASGAPPVHRLALRTSHPDWIVAAFAAALGVDLGGDLGGDTGPIAQALHADDERPQTHLIAYPGAIDRADLVAASGGSAGPWSPYAVRLTRGSPGQLAAVVDRRAGVQDEGSQLCATAMTAASLHGPDTQWLDMCAGPGGKAALLAAIGATRGAQLTANELHPRRAELVREATARWTVAVRVGDARRLDEVDQLGRFDRVLLDAPCSGLGALRRRPEARWRRGPDDVRVLAQLQRELLDAALRLARPGGLVAYVVCSPHPDETHAIVGNHELVDARPLFAPVPDLGHGPTVQLWPHLHGTDAMFFALVRRPAR
jgi:16S rRNA (cytosine967-C5)-methyltransferase